MYWLLHNVSKSFFFRDLQVTTDLFHEQETVTGNVYCTYMRFCVHREHQVLVLVVYSGNDTLMHVSHSAGSLSMTLNACSTEHQRFKLFRLQSKSSSNGFFIFSLVLQ